MSDYNPNLPPNPDRDPRNYQRYMDQDGNGRGLTLIVGILVAIAIAAGVMFFAAPSSDRVEQAQAPATRNTMTTPAPVTPAPVTPAPATPATPATPAR